GFSPGHLAGARKLPNRDHLLLGRLAREQAAGRRDRDRTGATGVRARRAAARVAPGLELLDLQGQGLRLGFLFRHEISFPEGTCPPIGQVPWRVRRGTLIDGSAYLVPVSPRRSRTAPPSGR